MQSFVPNTNRQIKVKLIQKLVPVNVRKSSILNGSTVLEKKAETVRKISPKYKVLLHNDPVNTMEYVVQTLRQVVPSLSEQDAINVMLEAHSKGLGLVIVCDLEPAEFYSETLKSKGLTSTIEIES